VARTPYISCVRMLAHGWNAAGTGSRRAYHNRRAVPVRALAPLGRETTYAFPVLETIMPSSNLNGTPLLTGVFTPLTSTIGVFLPVPLDSRPR
jgi:hypothetical protein